MNTQQEEHDIAAEELLHARIRQLEQAYEQACRSHTEAEDLLAASESRITSLEQQLDETQRMMISDVAQMRIAELESALRDVKTELNTHVNPSRPVLLQIVNSVIKS